MKTFNLKLACSAFLSFILFLSLFSCNKDELKTDTESDILSKNGKPDKIDICHYSADDDQWILINIKGSSWTDHVLHGDVRLDDQDGDGFVPDNECGFGAMGDCDDLNPNAYPGSEEVQDYYLVADNDGDGWYQIYDTVNGSCKPDGYLNFDEVILLNVVDCDDNNVDVYPGAPEICDDVDNDCDGGLLLRSSSATYAGQTFSGGTGVGTTGIVSGEFVHYDSQACDPGSGDDLTGKIAMIERNGCFFSQLAFSAQNAGAIGVIICNSGNFVIDFGAGTQDVITIPVIMLSSGDCQTILAGGGTVTIAVEDTCVEETLRTNGFQSKKASLIKTYTINKETGILESKKILQ